MTATEPRTVPTVRLNGLIRYCDGAVAEVYNRYDHEFVVPAPEVAVVETGVVGHAPSNAVVRFQGYHYLGTIRDADLTSTIRGA